MNEQKINELKEWLQENALTFDYGQNYSGIVDFDLAQLKTLKKLVEESIYEKIGNNSTQES